MTNLDFTNTYELFITQRKVYLTLKDTIYFRVYFHIKLYFHYNGLPVCRLFPAQVDVYVRNISMCILLLPHFERFMNKVRLI